MAHEHAKRSAHLSASGRRLVQVRLVTLREELAALRAAMVEGDRSRDLLEVYGRRASEYERLRRVLDDVVPGAAPGSEAVQVGDAVVLRFGDGTAQRYVVVNSPVAAPDAHAVPARSPLGRALLGAAAGSTVAVTVPGGAHHCTIVRIERRNPAPFDDGPGLET
jgi:transcription elongation factor GreA